MVEVSIYCITFNHKEYLANALESMLRQKTDFEFEIVVHDDASTDGTVEILREYEKKYPGKVIAIYEEKNQYSQGIDFSYKLFERMTGKYVAFCEGDDFWIDDRKLQKQFDAMEAHLECDMCACLGVTVTEDGENEISLIRPRESNGILSTEDVILGGGQYLVTAGLFFRKNMYNHMLPFEKVISLDYAQQIKGSLRGGIWYIDEKMAAYRRNAKGSWSMRILKQKENLKKQWEKERELLRVLDTDTGGKYHAVIEERLKSYTTFVEQLCERKDEVLKELASMKGSVYLWGMGRRGEEFEEFCTIECIQLDGICDLANEHVGETTVHGNKVISSTEVLNKADNILASNDFAYNDLKNGKFCGRLINLQQYMPYG